MTSTRIICAGLGPGDPDLMSLRAHRAISHAATIAYFRKPGRLGMARKIVDGMLRPDVTELAMEYPVTTEIPLGDPEYNRQLAAFYDDWADRLAQAGGEIVVLCEGDPFFYGSFMHLHLRLQNRAEIEIIPGITGMSGCWTATGQPITWGDDILTVLMGTLPEETLTARMAGDDALVVMKTGRNLPKVRRALERAGRLDAAWLVERGTMAGQRVQRLCDADATAAPYFAIVLVHGHGRRPLAEAAE
ncbi:MAG: precorrin-2 C(20)-methyltransferase [Paracoccus sp. (in: a-proteobacteria)]|uniref:precorrin-2 C(20)-methyltransferase n=1 Tax=Paracoccus sp. TaxID=267 RepID=UPI0026DFB509|nr:precorrin-2 C(20)-methyltransferase [Paracoccus sp. (in: a-proteobacteria)]MDO5620994.1 precorrin-2 C(20)-methyltransferase [Paracoccus sp. (in: a-proteobacteria)]